MRLGNKERSQIPAFRHTPTLQSLRAFRLGRQIARSFCCSLQPNPFRKLLGGTVRQSGIGRACPPLQPVPCLTALPWLPLRPRLHRCCPLHCAPGRLDGFSRLRSLRSVPLTHCGCAPASLTLIRCSASVRSGSTTLAPPRNRQGSRSGHRGKEVFAPLPEPDGDLQGCPGRAGVYGRYQKGSQLPPPSSSQLPDPLRSVRQEVGIYINIIQA